MKTTQFVAAVATLTMASPAAVRAAETTLSPSKDTALFSPSGDLSSGAGTLYAGKIGSRGGSQTRRALLAFDLAAIPAGSTIDSVSLTLRAIATSDIAARTFTLHRVTSNWGEGTSIATTGSGAPAAANDATWLHTFYNSATWTTPGGDFAPTPSASESIGGFGSYTFDSTPQLVADVQAWLDAPATRFGWLLRGDESLSQTVRAFDSRETGGGATGPALVIHYTPGPIPGDANLNGTLDRDDYSLIDRGFADSLTGFSNGDFNRDGSINAADYAILDNGFATQTNGPLPPDLLSLRLATFGESYTDLLLPTAIPEPAAATLALLPAATLLRRRRV
jgi:hypothetical protein